MAKELLCTDDLWLGSLLLSETDARLVDCQIRKNGRMTVTFSFEGENLSRLAKAYGRDEAVANVSQLRAKINTLRDLIFQARQS